MAHTPAKTLDEWLTRQPDDWIQVGLKPEDRRTVLLGLRALMAMDLRSAGNEHSGFYDHEGRKGHKGGSKPRGVASSEELSHLGPLEQDKVKFLQLRGEWAQLNHQLRNHLDDADSPEAQKLSDEMKALVKEMYTLDADPGGVEGIGLPGGPRDVVIVGAGPGGLNAAINGGTEGYDTLMIEAQDTVGGQAKETSRIENLPGFPIGVSGKKLFGDMYEQAQRTGADTMLGVRVTGMSYDPETDLKTVHLSNGEDIPTRSVIVAGGIEFKTLGLPGEDSENTVYGSADVITREAAGLPVVILGGGNSAAQAALAAATTGSDVYLVSRSPIEKGMSRTQADEVLASNVHVIEGDQASAIEQHLGGDTSDVVLQSGLKLPAAKVGVFIGGKSDTSWLPPDVERETTTGTIKVDGNLETTIPGVFVVGDMRTGRGYRVGTAAADGQMAIKNMHEYFVRVTGQSGPGPRIRAQMRHAKAATPEQIQQYYHLVDRLFELDKEDPWFGQTDTSEDDEQQQLKTMGGAGSGNFGHEGRPGEVGGSAPGDGSNSGTSAEDQVIINRPASSYVPVFAEGRDTQERYKDKDGHYTPERKALHDAIIRGIFANVTPEAHPSAIILGGGSASGKSTIERNLGLGEGNIAKINVDDIRDSIPDYREGLARVKATGTSDPSLSAFSHEEASDISKEALRYARERKLPVVLDGTGDSTLDKLGGKVAALRGAGYKVHGEYVTVPTQMAVDRAHERGLKIGRFVPESVTRSTHRAVSRVLPEAIRQGLFDTWRLHDNRKNNAPEVIAHGRKKNVTIDNQEKWVEFLEKAHEEW